MALGEVIQKGGRKRESRGSRWERYHKIVDNNLHIHIHINVQKSQCQIKDSQTKSVFKKICFETSLKS